MELLLKKVLLAVACLLNIIFVLAFCVFLHASSRNRQHLDIFESAIGYIFKANSSTGAPLRIAFGSNYFGDWTYWIQMAQAWEFSDEASCGVRCDMVFDTRTAHAVLFHGRDFDHNRKASRHHWQRWVYLNHESPMATKYLGFDVSSDPNKFRFMFNWTILTGLNSSIYLPYYGGWEPSKQTMSGPFYSPDQKKYMAFAVLSNCDGTFNNRKQKIAELQKYLTVHVYGRCGDRSLPKSIDHMRNVSKQYRFYLSFENAFCRDYITEKFHNNGLKSDAVPVAFGGLSREDYEKVSPPNSFVYALEFSSMRELAGELTKLAANESRYAGYFEWKRHFKASQADSILCSVCKQLHSNTLVPQYDLKQYYDTESNCRPRNYQYLT